VEPRNAGSHRPSPLHTNGFANGVCFPVVKPTVSNGASPTDKPTVLLVDDHPELSRSVSRLLTFDFRVIGIASNGDEAIDAVQRLEPDLIVMDVAMPGRDGFQTARELRRIGSRARIVFLSMHAAQEFVAEGFRSSARGYVLKTRLHADLVSALQRVQEGQLFFPSLEAIFSIDRGRVGHAVEFHPDEHAYINSISGFVNVSLRHGDPVMLLATLPVRAQIAARLRAYGWSVGESGEYGPYRAANVDDAVSSILRGGRVDAGRVEELVAELDRFRIAAGDGPRARLTVVGDLSSQFLLSGNAAAAVEMERLWDELTCERPFLTVCGYSLPQFSDDARADLLSELCAHHQAIAHSPEGEIRSLTT
jgi:DNA-binding NarL/FixJ family response regulator